MTMAVAKLKNEKNREYKYSVIKHLATLQEANERGISLELTIIDCGYGEKYDIRRWEDFGSDNEKMLKGVMLTSEETQNLYEALCKLQE